MTGNLDVQWIHGVRSKNDDAAPPIQVHRYDVNTYILRQSMAISHEAPFLFLLFGEDRAILFDTGDSVYPGRLYAFDMPAFTASLDHLVDFAQARPVTHVMGCHIEMSRQPGKDYPLGTKYQPEEPPLQMSMAQLRTVRTAAQAAAAKPGIYVHADFIIVNGMGLKNTLRLLIRSTLQRLGLR